MAEDVQIRDMGWSEAIDRLTALSRARVDVGIFGSGKVAKYAAINEHRFGWRTRAEQFDLRFVGARLAALQRAVVGGRGSFRQVLGDFADPYVELMKRSVLGLLGGRRLFLTGAMVEAVRGRVKVP